jgi:hypothetical protein
MKNLEDIMGRKKNEDTTPATEQDNLPATVTNSLLDDLEPLPDIRPLGNFDATTGTYRDSRGNPVQGPGIVEGRSGFFFIHHAGDFTEAEKGQWIQAQRQRGFLLAPKVTVDGYPTAVVLYQPYADWQRMRAQTQNRDPGPVGADGFTVDKWAQQRS